MTLLQAFILVLVPCAYGVGVAITGWTMMVRMNESMAQFKADLSMDKPLGTDDKAFNVVLGFGLGLIWPITLVVWAVSSAAPPTSFDLKKTSDEQAARIAELERRIADQAAGRWDGEPL